MTHYLLSVHSVEGEARDPMTEEEMGQFMERVGVLEEEMKSAGAWVFGGALHDPDTATVARVSDNEVLTTDGPTRTGAVPAPRRGIVDAELRGVAVDHPPEQSPREHLPQRLRRVEAIAVRESDRRTVHQRARPAANRAARTAALAGDRARRAADDGTTLAVVIAARARRLSLVSAQPAVR
jgi:hypothetical protein